MTTNITQRVAAVKTACMLYAALLAPAHAGAVPTADYSIAPLPAWVLPIVPPAGDHPHAAGSEGGRAFLLSDRQIRIDDTNKLAYTHVVAQATSSVGVTRLASVDITFDPSYQHLLLHRVTIVRGARRIDKLASAVIKVLQRETELDYQIYDGSKTVHIVLDDVRVGDIVDYAFSLAGTNPVFKNQHAGGANLQFSVMVDRVFVRLLAPSARQFTVKTLNAAPPPTVSVAGGYRDTRWQQDDVAAIPYEADTPPEYDPYAAAQWSEFADWAAVVRWALPLYQPRGQLSSDVRAEIERIRAASPLPAERVRKVLQLVQREIRYLGVEVGEGSHAPAPPSVVFQRRFGDCKDKTLLTVTMLQALGIDARPALVSTEKQKGVTRLLPTPNAFNHVLVRVRVDGATYWIDPTRRLQEGDLAHLYQPDYGVALVLEEAANALVPMTAARVEQKHIVAVFDSRKGLDAPVGYTVTTSVQGGQAESLRADIASGTVALEKRYLNFYARNYPAIKQVAPMKVRDDGRANTVTTVETYEIADFWQAASDGKRRNATVRAGDIRTPLYAPDTLNRSAPFKLRFPEDIVERTEVKLPSSGQMANEHSAVTDPAFMFTGDVRSEDGGRTLVMTDHYQSRADHVDPQAMAAYGGHLRSALESLGYDFNLVVGDPQAAADKEMSGAQRVGAGIAIAIGLGMMAWGLKLRQQPWYLARTTGKKLADIAIPATVLVVLAVLMPAVFAFAVPLVFALTIWSVRQTIAAAPEQHWAARWYRRLPHAPAIVTTLGVRHWPALIGWLFIGEVLVQLAKS